jgi:hypothetical protein
MVDYLETLEKLQEACADAQSPEEFDEAVRRLKKFLDL